MGVLLAGAVLLWLTLISLCQGFSSSVSLHLQTAGLSEAVKNFTQQKLDHFSSEDDRVFSQQYFESLEFFNDRRGPIILMVCGEWDCFGSYGEFTAELAKVLGAAVVTVEHRYYGQSSPFEDLTVENLKYLTSDQALQDLASFRDYYQKLINENYNKEDDNPWFVIGQSYPGALSAWFRLKFPHLVRGSLASSAVVQAIFNYSAYDEQVGISVGAECASVLREITHLAEEGLASNATAIKSVFSAQELLDEDFLSFLADVVAANVQSARSYLVCPPLLQAKRAHKDLLIAYANITSEYNVSDWNREIIKARSRADQPHSDRTWTYQYCTEFGFFQVAATNGIRSSRINSKYQLDFCTFIFGNGTYPKVEETNLNYGGSNISGSNILFMNGSQDPWSHASKLTSSPGEPSFLVRCDTCSHGVDLKGCSAPDGTTTQECKEQLAKARSLIISYAKEWLSVNPYTM